MSASPQNNSELLKRTVFIKKFRRSSPYEIRHHAGSELTLNKGLDKHGNPLPKDANGNYVPLDEYVANLQAIVTAAKAAGGGGARVLLITPPPCDHEAWHAYCAANYGDVPKDADPNRLFEVTKQYAQAVVRLGAETGTPTLDLHGKFEERADWKALFKDGLHPNIAGGQFIGEEVLAAIAHHFPELLPSALPMDFPDHKAIDVDRIDGTFEAYAIEHKR